MLAILWIVLTYLLSFFRRRHDFVLEVLALRHQVMVLQRQTRKPKLHPSDRYLWMLLMKVWPNWRTPLLIFQPETLIAWQRSGFRMFWRWKSRCRLGRPGKDAELIQLIRWMWALNPTWGSPRIRDELAKLGLKASTATIRKYRPKSRGKPSQGWRNFLQNHSSGIARPDVARRSSEGAFPDQTLSSRFGSGGHGKMGMKTLAGLFQQLCRGLEVRLQCR
jgi:hypothetical protein